MSPENSPVASPAALDLLHLRLAPAINRNRFRALVHTFGSYRELRTAGPAAIQQVLRCSDSDAAAMLAGPTHHRVDQEIAGLAALGARMICHHDDDYPRALLQSQAPPPLLFMRGTLLPGDQAAVAMIGSRKATAYGMAAAASIATSLARAGITIVSGFARGVDTAAHKSALEGGGRTLAILGNGLDICYPSENRALVPRVIESGALLTEYPLGTESRPENFPERNQIIAALALGTAVMEAAERSGTLITCRHALEDNRLLFALPGDVTRHNSRGTNRLIREGAILIQDGADILRELAPQLRALLNGWKLEDYAPEEDAQDNRPGRLAARPKSPQSQSIPLPNRDSLHRERSRPPTQPDLLAADQSLSVHGRETAISVPPNPNGPGDLPPEATVILQIILREPIQFDDLAAEAGAAGVPASKVASQVLRLELRGLIRQMPGRIYAAL